MRKAPVILTLSLAGLMASATVALAQTSDSSKPAAKSPGLFSGLRLEPWEDKPKAKTDAAVTKEPGLFSGLRLEPWHEAAEAPKVESSAPALTKLAEKPTQHAARKTGLFSALRLEPWREADAGAAEIKATKAEAKAETHTSNFSAPGLRLQRWDEKDDTAGGR